MIEAIAAILIFFASLYGPDVPPEDDALTGAMIATATYALATTYECEPIPIYEWFHDASGVWIGASCAVPEAAAGFTLVEGKWTFEIHED